VDLYVFTELRGWPRVCHYTRHRGLIDYSRGQGIRGVLLRGKERTSKYRARRNAIVGAVSEVLKIAKDEKTKKAFTESVELQVGLKNYTLQKDKRFSGTIRLSEGYKNSNTICESKGLSAEGNLS